MRRCLSARSHHESAIARLGDAKPFVRRFRWRHGNAVGVALGAFFTAICAARHDRCYHVLRGIRADSGCLDLGWQYIAVMVAALNGGLSKAIIMLIIILVVQQMSQTQPFMMSNAVSLRPWPSCWLLPRDQQNHRHRGRDLLRTDCGLH